MEPVGRAGWKLVVDVELKLLRTGEAFFAFGSGWLLKSCGDAMAEPRFARSGWCVGNL